MRSAKPERGRCFAGRASVEYRRWFCRVVSATTCLTRSISGAPPEGPGCCPNLAQPRSNLLSAPDSRPCRDITPALTRAPKEAPSTGPPRPPRIPPVCRPQSAVPLPTSAAPSAGGWTGRWGRPGNSAHPLSAAFRAQPRSSLLGVQPEPRQWSEENPTRDPPYPQRKHVHLLG